MLRHDTTFPPPDDRVELAASLLQALADPTRLLLLAALAARPDADLSVGELVELVGRPQSTVSRHLGVLRGADLVRTRRDAQRVHYRIANVHVADLVGQALSHADHLLGGIPHEHPHAP